MPTLAQEGLPIPETFEEFESIVCDVFTSMFGIQFQKWGRKGQKQEGIDLIGENIGVQCKNYQTAKLTTSLIEADIQKAEQLMPPLSRLYIVTTASRDVTIQKYIMQRKGNLYVELYYWDVIERYLLQNEQILKCHYFNSISTDNTQNFINEFLKLCNKYSISEAIYDVDYVSPYRDYILTNIECFGYDAEELINSDISIDVKKKILKKAKSFRDTLDNILKLAVQIGYPNGNGYCVPSVSSSERKKIENFFFENRQFLSEIYSEFKYE